MRLLLRLAVLLLGLVPWAIRAQAQGAAFSCDGTFYQIKQVGTTSSIYTVDRTTANYSPTPLNIVNGGNDLGVLVNSLAYNSQDNFLYALSTSGSGGNNTYSPVTLYKIGQGGIVSLGTVRFGGSNLAIVPATGTFDKVGNYYFTSQNTGTGTGGTDYNLYKLVPGSSTPLLATRTALSSNITMYDMAFNPIDGLLYGAITVGSLYKVDPSSAAVTTISTGTGQSVGTVFFDVAGNLYTYSNGTGTTTGSARFYQVGLSDGTYTLLSNVDPASVSDGASCINPGSSIDVTKTATSVQAVNATTFNITYAIRVRNTYSPTLTNVQVSDLLKGNTTTTTNVTFPTATSVSIITAPAVTNTGGSLVANTSYTGLPGGGSLLSGTRSLATGQQALITYTVQVQFASPPANLTANNTAYATSSSASSNRGYTLTSTDVLLSPNDLVSNDASTNSASFPAQRTSATNGTPNAVDTPSPTPVTFPATISGVVFEDVNYGGGLGRSQAASNGVGRSGARVELFLNGSYSTFTTTAADGSYSFTGTSGAGLAAGNYTVRVLSNTVSSSRNTGNASNLVGVQTYRTSATAAGGTVGDPNRVGGEYPAWTEAINGSSGATIASLNANAATAGVESIAAVTLSANNPATGIDFGYNFDTVVNTNNTGQGSLRQFIANANALDNTNLDQDPASTGGNDPIASVETSIFMIPDGAAHDGLTAYNASTNPGLISQLTNGVAAINITNVLPSITGTYAASTVIDGTTQTQNVGDTNTAVLGTGGTVGTAATALGKVNGPEVQLKGTRSYEGLTVLANQTTIRGLSIYGFTNDIGVGTDYTGLLIEQNVLGSTATSFTDPGNNVRSTQQGVNLYNSDNGIVRNNLIGFNGGMGIWVYGDGNGANGNTITGNEIRGNGQEVNANGEGLVFDGLELQGASTGNTVSGNLITASLGHGIDSYGNTIGGNTITGNTISNNGQGIVNNNSGLEGSGLRIYGATNTTTIANNVLSGNNGSGVLVESGAAKVVISQNSTFGNTRLGIDLVTNANISAAASNEYNGTTGSTSNVTLNSATTAGGNALVNYPIITSATVVGTNLLVQGYAKSTASIELFIAQANTSTAATPNDKFGQGLTYLTTLTEGATSGVTDTDTRTGQSYSGTINGVNQGTDTNANGFSFLVPLTAAQQAAVTSGTLLTSTATLGGATSEFSGNATATVTAPLTGYVYEDVNYGGGAGRSRATAGPSAVTRPGAKVELYDNTGAYVSTAITDANGQYSFSVVPGSYTVRVVNSSVLSSRGQAASTYSGDATNGYTNTLLPVQTYNGTTTRVGGQNPAYTDAAANTGTQALSALTSGTTLPESVATVSVAQGASTNAGPDFGYNFDVVVNTSNTGQGSLRQFVANANALGNETNLAQSGSRVDATGTTQTLPTGKETSIFMIPDGTAHAGLLASTNGGPASQLTNGVAVITAASTLTLTGANATSTIIDGTTQSFNIGNTNSGTATNTSTRTVGTDALSLTALQKPEVELVGTNITSVLDLEAATATVRGLAVHGSNTQDILVGSTTASTGYVLENLLIGTAADGTRPGSNATGNYGIYLGGSAGVGTTQNALVGFTGNSGIDIANGTGTAGTTQILSSFFTKNGYVSSGGDGITIGDKALAGPVNIAGNSFSFINSSGIQFEIGSTSASTVTNNTIDNAGNINDAGAANSNLEGSAIDYLQRDGNRRGAQADVISKNVLTNTAASGIVIGYGQQNVTLSQNSIYNSGTSAANGSGKVGIDLIGSNQSVNSNNGVYGMGDGVTLNDGNAPASATTDLANRGVDFPVITSAVITGGNLVVSGYSRPGAVIELFSPGSPANATNFGEGQTYLGTVTEGATTGIVDNDGGTGSYTGTQPNGLNEGTDTGANRFSFTIPLTGRFAGYTFNSLLTSTATLNNSTSEFSGIVRAITPPVPNDATNVSIPNNTTTPVALNPSLSGTAYGNTANVTTATATAIVSYTVSLPSSGTLYYNNVALTGPTTVAANNLANLKFVPAFGSTGSATFTYTTTDTDGLTSTQHSTGGTLSNGPATYTIPLTNSADVTTALAGPTQVNAGQPVTYTATFTNNGPQTANGVTRVLALPSGATLTSAQIAALPTGATYNSGANTISYSATTTLTSGSSTTTTFTFTAPTPVGTATLTSTVGTNGTPDQGVNAAPDVATLTLNVTEVANVSATVTASASPVQAGGAASFNVTFANAGPQTAANTTFSVQLPAGLGSGVTVTNTSGTVVGSYNNTTGVVTYTSPPASLAPAGQAMMRINFTMPTTGLPVTAVATIGTSTSEAGQTSNNVASATITSSPAFDLTTSLSGPNTVITGNTGTLYVTTTNNGPSAAMSVVQTVSIGTGLSTANLFISNGGTYDSGTGIVTFPTLATLPSGQTVGNTISFVIPAASVTFEPTATVRPNTSGAGETNTANNTARLNGAAANTTAAQVTTVAKPATTVNVYTTIATTSQIVTPGSAITYTVTAGNAGNTTASAADVTTSVQLLPGLTGTTLTLGGTTGTAGTGANVNVYSYTFNDNTGTSRTATYDATTGLVSISTISALPSGSERTFTLVMTPPAIVIGNSGQILATSSVATNQADAMPADNLDAVRVLVSPTADLATVVTGPTSMVAGLPVTYGVTFSNNGPGLGTSVVETAQLPRNLASVTILDNTGAAVSGATYSATTGLVTFPAQTSLAAGTSQAYTVSFTAPNTASYPVSATISGSTADGNSANNSSSVTTTTSALADVTVAVSGPASAVVGNPVTYDVTTTNNGPSAAASVSTTLQLPSGVAQANVLAAPAGTTYSVSGGITTATFTSVSSLASGASVSNYLTFTMPANATAPATGIATVATTTTESNAGNNQQAVQTDVAPATTTTADLGTTIAYSGNPTTVVTGTSLTLTATFTNGSTAAVGSVVPRIYLPAGLSLTSITSDAALGTGTYDSSTGVVTFAPITMAAGASLTSTIVLPAPASGPVVATSSITSNTTDPTSANNVASASVAITSAYDEVTTISGPASALPASTAVYTVQTINNGPTASTSAVTQTVTLPSGVTVVPNSISGGGTVSGSTITWTIPTGQAAGANGIVTNTFSVNTPAVGTTSYTLNASVTAPGESNTGNNTAATTTTRTNQPPVALNVTNLLQSPQSNTAGPLLITPLNANDPQSSALTYKLTSIPTASSQGVLSYNDGTANGTYTDITTANYATLSLSAAQIATLKFDPVSNYVGNVFFTYTATDALTLTSNEAFYTIRVGQDNNSTYTVAATKGGSNPYQNADVLATAFDWNGGRYTSAGAISATNGVGSITQTSGTLPAGTTLYTVPTTVGGVTYSAGQVVVTDRTKLVAGSYPITVQTVDSKGGVNTVSFTIVIGAYPLPVTLVAFTAQAVQNRDALLSWSTASEANNDHFDVERSFDGTSFVKIGQLAGHGTTTVASAYSLTDANVAAKATGPVYYRLRQVDLDGSATYSPVRTVSFTSVAAPVALSLYPNPAQASTTLELSQLPATGTYQVQLLDATGRTVRAVSLGGGLPQPLDISDLATGAYHVLVTGQLADGSPFKQTLRLTKE